MERSQFTFYESFFKAVSRIKPAAVRAQAYDAICAYALYGTEPDMGELPDSAAIAFELIKPNLDSSRRKANGGKNGSPRKDNGKLTERCEKDTAKIEERFTEDGENKKKKENEKEKEREKEKENECYKKTRPRFSPPTLEEVQAYVLERNSPVDPQAFIDFYESKGWVVGKTPMKDWKAACRNAEKWERWNTAKPYTPSVTGNVFADLVYEGAFE